MAITTARTAEKATHDDSFCSARTKRAASSPTSSGDVELPTLAGDEAWDGCGGCVALHIGLDRSRRRVLPAGGATHSNLRS